MTTPETTAFNKPYKLFVAIDCRHIGDDNDYSCFLSRVVYELYCAGNIETAYTLSRTDSLLNVDWTPDEFLQEMERRKIIQQEDSERLKDQWKFYTD